MQRMFTKSLRLFVSRVKKNWRSSFKGRTVIFLQTFTTKGRRWRIVDPTGKYLQINVCARDTPVYEAREI